MAYEYNYKHPPTASLRPSCGPLAMARVLVGAPGGGCREVHYNTKALAVRLATASGQLHHHHHKARQKPIKVDKRLATVNWMPTKG